jgi:hypothetical protein
MRTRHEPATAPAGGKVAGAGCPQAAKLQGRPGVYWWPRTDPLASPSIIRRNRRTERVGLEVGTRVNPMHCGGARPSDNRLDLLRLPKDGADKPSRFAKLGRCSPVL